MQSILASRYLVLTVCGLSSGLNTLHVPTHFNAWPPREAGNVLLVTSLRCEVTDPRRHGQEEGLGSDPGRLSLDSLFFIMMCCLIKRNKTRRQTLEFSRRQQKLEQDKVIVFLLSGH